MSTYWASYPQRNQMTKRPKFMRGVDLVLKCSLGVFCLLMAFFALRGGLKWLKESDRVSHLKRDFSKQHIAEDCLHMKNSHHFCSVTIADDRFCYYWNWDRAINLDCKVFDRVKQKWILSNSKWEKCSTMIRLVGCWVGLPKPTAMISEVLGVTKRSVLKRPLALL